MSKPVNISIPDELHSRWQAVKGEFNVSRVCQEAIKNKVTAIEVAKNESMRDYIMRTKEEAFQGYVEQGKKLAHEALKNKHIDYSDMMEIMKLKEDNDNAELHGGDIDFYSLLKEALKNGDVFDSYIKEYGNDGQHMPDDAWNYLAEGFILGVAEVAEELAV